MSRLTQNLLFLSTLNDTGIKDDQKRADSGSNMIMVLKHMNDRKTLKKHNYILNTYIEEIAKTNINKKITGSKRNCICITRQHDRKKGIQI